MLDRYARVTFDKALIAGQPQAELLAPGHPLLDARSMWSWSVFSRSCSRAACWWTTQMVHVAPRLLVYLEHAIRDGRVG